MSLSIRFIWAFFTGKKSTARNYNSWGLYFNSFQVKNVQLFFKTNYIIVT